MPITRHSRFVHKRKYAFPALRFLLVYSLPSFLRIVVAPASCFYFYRSRVCLSFQRREGSWDDTSRTTNREEIPRDSSDTQPRRQWGTIIDVRSIIEHRINQSHHVIALWSLKRGIRPIFTSNRNHALASSIFHLVLRCANICFTPHTLVSSLHRSYIVYRVA